MNATAAIAADATDAPDTATGMPRLMYYENLVDAPVRHFGPLTFSSALLDQLLDLMGEKHPIHDNDELARSLTQHEKRIVPGGFINSITSGWAVRHGAAGAIVGLKSMTWDFVRPLYPDVPFHFTTEVESAEEINDRIGVLKIVRRVFYEPGQTIAIGRMTVVVARRAPHGAQAR
jgi:acyl dehydratase